MKSIALVLLIPSALHALGSSCALVGGEYVQNTADTAEVIVYELFHKPAGDIEKLLKPLLPRGEEHQIFSDPKKNKIYIRGSKQVHKIASQLINSVDRASSPNSQIPSTAKDNPDRNSSPRIEPLRPNGFNGRNLKSVKPSTVDSNTGNSFSRTAQPVINRLVLVRQGDLADVEKQLLGVFQDNVSLKRNSDREIYIIALQNRSNDSRPRIFNGEETRIEIEFDKQRNGVLIGGPTRIVNQMATLCQALAENRLRDGQRTKVFRVQKQNQNEIRRLIRPSQPSRNEGAKRQGGSRIQPASFVFQEEPNRKEPQEENNNAAAAIQQFEGVEIETMPDLDVIILRGRDQDLKQLEEIIKQIERISRETQPVVQVYQLRHTNSDALSEIISETRDDLVGGRQGRINVLPLAKPNALLLIGWGDAVKAVLDLIRQLDVPIDAKSQFRVFRLKHAPATTVNQSIEQFFADRGNLSPRVTGIVDTRTNSIVVYASPRDMQEVIRMVKELDVQGGMAVNRTQIIPIRNSLAADVAQTLESAISAAASNSRTAVMEIMAFDEKGQKILRSGSLNDIQITPNLRNNTLIVSSPKENFDLIQELIRQLDTPTSRSQLKIFKIYNSDAADLVQTLRSLIPGSTSASGNIKLPTAPDEISLTPLRFSVDVRSNSILATGSEGDLRIAEALIAKLDESTSSQRKTEVYPLKNSPAVEVANAINTFLQSSRLVENAAPGSQNPFQEIEREVIVVPEPVANKLLVSATSRYFEEISKLIEKLDEQPPQVMIQVLIAEVKLNDTDEFGVELGLQDSVLFDRSLLGDLVTTTNTSQQTIGGGTGVLTATQEIIQAASNIPGFNFNSTQPLGNSGSTQSVFGAGDLGAQGISNFSVTRSGNFTDFGGLVLSASSQNVSLLLRALQETRRVDILSRPQVRTLDNQPAFIQVGERVPRIIGSTVNQNGQSNSVTLENVGLILGVTPRISPDGTVVMEIDAEKSDLGSEQDGVPVAVSTDGTVIRSPRVETTTAQATVSAADGETIVLGGLITKNTQQINRSVPYLNRVPLLRNFFKYDGLNTERTELMIILTPRVIRSPEDSAKIRQIETARMNWAAADVFEIHGEIDALESINTTQLDASEPPVIYPVNNPRGLIRKTGSRLDQIRNEGILGGRFRQNIPDVNEQ